MTPVPLITFINGVQDLPTENLRRKKTFQCETKKNQTTNSNKLYGS